MRFTNQFTSEDSTSPPCPLSASGEGVGGEVYKWRTSPQLWEKLKPLAREMRQTPTLEEDILWQKLHNRGLLGYKFRRQHAIDRFIVDFYCAEARPIVEVNGPVHQYTHEEDAIRQDYLESLGLRVLRFNSEEISDAIPDVLDRIAHAVSSPVTK